MVLGIDIGGTHITAALVSEEPTALIADSVVRNKVDAQGTVEEILEQWSAPILEVWKARGITNSKIGIAMPGPFNYTEGIALMKGTTKYEAIYQQNVRIPLAERLGIPPDWIVFRNDAEAFLLGEMKSGAGAGYESAIGITLGTGLGSSVYNDGATRDADRWNRPFKDGIAEEYISTRFFVNRYAQLTGKAINGAKKLSDQIATDPVAAQLYQEFSYNLSRFLRDFIRDEAPQVIIIGGSISKAWPIIYPWLSEYLQEELKTVALKQALLGEDAALIGGACSWIDVPADQH